MSGQLPTLIIIGGMIGAGIVLLNPELRCSLLGICGQLTGSKPEVEDKKPEEPPPQTEEEDDDGNQTNIYYNINNPPPIVVGVPYRPPPPPRVPYVVRYASNGCCECKTHTDGVARCRTKGYGPYTISYNSAKHDVVRAASLCARNK